MIPLAGRDLIMAYEENGDVKPVVSDFDCFLIGTRGVKYSEPLPDEQIDLMKWCIDETEQILMHGDEKSSWTSQWLEVLKKAHMKGFHPETPRVSRAQFYENTSWLPRSSINVSVISLLPIKSTVLAILSRTPSWNRLSGGFRMGQFVMVR